MNLIYWEPVAFLYGALAGIVCVLGLIVGVKLLFAAQTATDSASLFVRRRRIFAPIILVGQFAGAAALMGAYVKQSAGHQVAPLSLAGGLLSSIIVANVVFAATRK